MSMPFLALIALTTLQGFLYAALAVSGSGSAAGLGGSMAVSAAIGLSAWVYYKYPPSRAARTILVLALAIAYPLQYGYTGRAIQHLGLTPIDPVLIRMDQSLFGWIFPDGQISVWIDRSSWIGPLTLLGRFITELCQWAYVSYYLWGYGLLIILLVRYLMSPRPLAAAAEIFGEADRRWTQLQMFLIAWVGGAHLNYWGYVFVPAIGPRYFSPDQYAHPIPGFGAAAWAQDVIQSYQATATDCFPSGHTALSWITAVAALRFAPRYGLWAAPFAVLITFATVVLRYHYVTDLLAAVPLILFALAWSRIVPVPGIAPRYEIEGIPLLIGSEAKSQPRRELGPRRHNDSASFSG